MNVQEAKGITGGLSNPSKMPGKTYNLPAIKACPNGCKLSEKNGTVCNKCYATKGRYVFPNVQNALDRRWNSITALKWSEAMIKLISGTKSKWFRWHDSGDIVSMEYLYKIMYIVENLPEKKFWIPTLETEKVEEYVKNYDIPNNIIIRISSKYIGKIDKLPTSLQNYTNIKRSVTGSNSKSKNVYHCPALEQGNECGNCRACWNTNNEIINYHYH